MALRDGAALGSAEAPVTLEVFSDFQCPVCGAYATDVEPLLVNLYVTTSKLRVVHHDIAFLGRGGAGDESVLSASAAACADEQDAYWPYHDWLFANQDGENRGGFSRDRLLAIADEVGLDREAFSACLDRDSIRSAVASETSAAKQLGVKATPTFKIGDQVIEGLQSVQALGALIEAAAASPSPAAPSPSP
jgi:protein-disulfide isomerase